MGVAVSIVVFAIGWGTAHRHSRTILHGEGQPVYGRDGYARTAEAPAGEAPRPFGAVPGETTVVEEDQHSAL
jgi:hypothetical protein